MSKTFFALLELADLSESTKASPKKHEEIKHENPEETPEANLGKQKQNSSVGLHYNIQIHLPATKDVEVYNAIFKSLKDHLIE